MLSALGWIIALLGISVLIVAHEWGHYFFARLFDMRVHRFSVGFGPSIYRRQVGETEFQVSAFPIGGYVMIDGLGPSEDEEDTDEAPEPQTDAGRRFGDKPLWQRVAVIAAGPIVNWVLAAALFALVGLGFARPVQPIATLNPSEGLSDGAIPTAIEGRSVGSLEGLQWTIENAAGVELNLETQLPDTRAGAETTLMIPEGIGGMGRAPFSLGRLLEPLGNGVPTPFAQGDRIESIAGYQVRTYEAAVGAVLLSGGEEVEVSLRRAGTRESFQHRFDTGPLGYGIAPWLGPAELEDGWGSMGLLEAFQLGIGRTALLTKQQAVILGGKALGKDAGGRVLGPRGILQILKERALTSPGLFLSLLALISVGLFFFNLLPVPALDGGRLIFMGIEVVRGKPISPEVEGTIHAIGFIALIAFFVFVTIAGG